MSAGPAENSRSPLDYAQRPRLPWVSRHRRLLIFLAICIAGGIPAFQYWQPIKQRVLWLYWSRRAAQFVMPAKATDVIADSARAKQLLASNSEYQPDARGYAFFQPLAFRNLALYEPRLRLALGNMGGDGVVFLGTLHRPDGTPRLVLIAGGSGITGNLMNFSSAVVLPLPNWSDPVPATPPFVLSRGFLYTGPPPTPTRFKTAVRDPLDPSHLVLEFEAGGPGFSGNQPPWTISATGAVDAHLKNDDSLAFTLQSFNGRDPNIRVGSSVMTGDVQTLQQQVARYGRPFAPIAPSSTKPSSGQKGR